MPAQQPEEQDEQLALADLLPLEVARRRALRQAWRLLGLGAAVPWPEAVGVLVLAAWLQDGHAPARATAGRAAREVADLVSSGTITDDLFASASKEEVLVGHGLADQTLHGLVTSVHLADVCSAVVEALRAKACG